MTSPYPFSEYTSRRRRQVESQIFFAESNLDQVKEVTSDQIARNRCCEERFAPESRYPSISRLCSGWCGFVIRNVRIGK